jgi:hypothetical protein
MVLCSPPKGTSWNFNVVILFQTCAAGIFAIFADPALLPGLAAEAPQ